MQIHGGGCIPEGNVVLINLKSLQIPAALVSSQSTGKRKDGSPNISLSLSLSLSTLFLSHCPCQAEGLKETEINGREMGILPSSDSLCDLFNLLLFQGEAGGAG